MKSGQDADAPLREQRGAENKCEVKSPSDGSTLAAALAYAARGWRVHPLRPRSKLPLLTGWPDKATTDPDTIRAWWRDHPQAGIGIATGRGLLVLDVDAKGEVDGHATLAELVRDHGGLTLTYTVTTPTGGQHLYLATGADLRNTAGALGPGLDTRADGGYVVAPPTVVDAGRYAVAQDGDLAPAPAWLWNLLRAPKAPAPRVNGAIPAGSRNDHLYRDACRLRRDGADADAILAELREIPTDPPLPETELRQIAESACRHEPRKAASITDFHAYLPGHQYLYVPTRELWPASSVDAHVASPADMRPSRWLDQNRPIVQLAWHPAEPELIDDRVLQVAGWIDQPGVRVFNLYRPPAPPVASTRDPGLWLEHVRFVYPDDAMHIIAWLAFKVQRPGEKVNHALVLGGMQGIGKDTLLEPVKAGVGQWNWQEISPAQMLGRFNAWAKAVIVRVSEARDLGDVDRFSFYDHSKTYIAAPPDVLRVDEKHLREHYVANVLGLVITSNHLTDGIYLPADDRRHFVAWSPRSRDDFPADYWPRLYRWFADGGTDAVRRYLMELDLSGFDPKAPPPKTPAFWQVVAAGEAPESGELRDIIEAMGTPPALTLDGLVARARGLGAEALADEMTDRKARRSVPHKLERVDYIRVRNPDASDGLFKVAGRRQAVYAQRTLTVADQIRAARELL